MIKRYETPLPVNTEQVVKADREEGLRSRLRGASLAEELDECVDLAEKLGMSYEASLGRRKLSKLYPLYKR